MVVVLLVVVDVVGEQLIVDDVSVMAANFYIHYL